MADDSTFLFKEPCPACGSRDNLARYSDGHAFCFGCEHYEPGDGDEVVVAALLVGKLKRGLFLSRPRKPSDDECPCG